jgi:hypothetical protein
MAYSGAKRAAIERNLAEVRRRIAAACAHSGRKAENVALIAVTKTAGLEEIGVLFELGVRQMGENRVQEAAAKITLAPAGIEWHMIGNLQRNKVGKAMELFNTFDAVDSERLALEIDKHATRAGAVVPLLLEVNTSGEAAKHGVPVDELRALAECVRALPNVRVEGLLTMAALTGDAAEQRRCFQNLRTAAEGLSDLAGERFCMRRLSMGMTQDFETAIEEGATEVRIGSALFTEKD